MDCNGLKGYNSSKHEKRDRGMNNAENSGFEGSKAESARSSARIERRFPKPTPKSHQTSAAQAVTGSVEEFSAKSPAILLQKYPDLALILDAWPDLPEPVKAGILAMIKAAIPNRQS